MNERRVGPRRLVLPLGVFVAVAAVHFAWFTIFPERDPIQDQWVTQTTVTLSPARYIETGSSWLGLSYALALAFAATAFQRYREEKLCGARTLAVGSLTFTGFFAVAGCYLLGCCGSPMLAVYVSVFGAHFLPLTRPLVAAFTLLSIVVAWWWMNRARASATVAACTANCAPSTPSASLSRSSNAG